MEGAGGDRLVKGAGEASAGARGHLLLVARARVGARAHLLLRRAAHVGSAPT